jgi:hypothetical protein
MEVKEKLVIPALNYVIKKYAMKAYGNGGIAPRILDLGIGSK